MGSAQAEGLEGMRFVMRRKEKPVLGTNLAGETAECESYMKTGHGDYAAGINRSICKMTMD
jgi:hypothetical protein